MLYESKSTTYCFDPGQNSLAGKCRYSPSHVGCCLWECLHFCCGITTLFWHFGVYKRLSLMTTSVRQCHWHCDGREQTHWPFLITARKQTGTLNQAKMVNSVKTLNTKFNLGRLQNVFLWKKKNCHFFPSHLNVSTCPRKCHINECNKKVIS